MVSFWNSYSWANAASTNSGKAFSFQTTNPVMDFATKQTDILRVKRCEWLGIIGFIGPFWRGRHQ